MDASVAVVLLTELLGAKRRWCSWSFAVFSRGKGSEPDMAGCVVMVVSVVDDACFSVMYLLEELNLDFSGVSAS
jgi:hypothetical protein